MAFHVTRGAAEDSCENLLHKVAFSWSDESKREIPVDKHLGKWMVSCLNVEPLKTDPDPQRG